MFTDSRIAHVSIHNVRHSHLTSLPSGQPTFLHTVTVTMEALFSVACINIIASYIQFLPVLLLLIDNIELNPTTRQPGVS